MLTSAEPTGEKSECYTNLTEAELALLFNKEQALRSKTEPRRGEIPLIN